MLAIFLGLIIGQNWEKSFWPKRISEWLAIGWKMTGRNWIFAEDHGQSQPKIYGRFGRRYLANQVLGLPTRSFFLHFRGIQLIFWCCWVSFFDGCALHFFWWPFWVFPKAGDHFVTSFSQVEAKNHMTWGEETTRKLGMLNLLHLSVL